MRMLQGFTDDPLLLRQAAGKAFDASSMVDRNPLDDPMSDSNVLKTMSGSTDETTMSFSGMPGGGSDSGLKGGQQGGSGSSAVAGLLALQMAMLRGLEKESDAVRLDIRVETTLRAMQAIARYVSGYSGRKNLIWM